MAEPWTTSGTDDQAGGPPPRPFDRQALQATLADAVRTAESESPIPVPDEGRPTPPQPATSEAVASRPAPPAPRRPMATSSAGGEDAPPRPVNRPLNPFSRPGVPSAQSAGAVPAPPAVGRPIPGAPAAPASSGIANPTGGLGGLRHTSPSNLGPINFSGTADLAGRSVSGLSGGAGPAEAPPMDRPTIPLRRRPQPEQQAAPKPQPLPAPVPAPAAARTMAPINGWLPSDDDILPKRPARRGRSFRRSR